MRLIPIWFSPSQSQTQIHAGSLFGNKFHHQ